MLLPSNFGNYHLIIIKICLKERKLVIYDSLVKSEDSKRIRVEYVKPLVSLLPIILRSSAYYDHVTAPMNAHKKWDAESIDPQHMHLP